MSTNTFTLVDETVLERTAQILGPQSAAHQALDEVKARRSKGEDLAIVKSGATLLIVPKADLVPASGLADEAPPAIDPAEVRIGRGVRRRPAGHGCRVEAIREDWSQVQIRDNNRLFWVKMSTLIEKWY